MLYKTVSFTIFVFLQNICLGSIINLSEEEGFLTLLGLIQTTTTKEATGR